MSAAKQVELQDFSSIFSLEEYSPNGRLGRPEDIAGLVEWGGYCDGWGVQCLRENFK